MWINEPYECGRWPDISIFWDSLVRHLKQKEKLEADDRYVGDQPQHVKFMKDFRNPNVTEVI